VGELRGRPRERRRVLITRAVPPMALSPLDVVVPGAIRTRTGGYVYDRRLVEALRERGRTVVVHELDGPWPQPDEVTRERAHALFAALPDGRHALVDGLAFGALPDVASSAGERLSLIALVHHPLALEGGLSSDDEARIRHAEQRALASAAHVLTTSPATTAALVTDYGVAADRVTTVPPGTDPAPRASGTPGGAENLLCVATLTRRKGHDVLLDALAGLVDRPWHLVCTGSATRDRATADALRERIRQLDLAARVTLDGELDDTALAERWQAADLFVLASRFEGYGMVFDEAFARALPVLASGAGAVADTVPTDAGLVVPPDDVDALRTALARWFDEPELRDALRAGAGRARESRRDWHTVADEVGHVIDALPARRPSADRPA